MTDSRIRFVLNGGQKGGLFAANVAAAKAEVCKPLFGGSIPPLASNNFDPLFS
jgi:hypothetical protein